MPENTPDIANETQKDAPRRDFTPVPIPTEYNHLKKKHTSPLADATLERVKERMQTNLASVTFIDLQQIINSELLDIEDQQEFFEKTPIDESKPLTDQEKQRHEWRQQKTMIEKVRKYFDTHADQDEIDVTVLSDANVDHKYRLGRSDKGTLFYTFNKSNIDSMYEETHSFESQIEQMKSIEESVMKIIVDEPITPDEKVAIFDYVNRKIDHYADLEDQYEKDTDENQKARANCAVFGNLFEKIFNFNNEAVSEAERILEEANAANSVVKKAEKIDRQPQKRKTKPTNRNRHHPPGRRN